MVPQIAFLNMPGGEISTFRKHLGTAYIQAYLKKHGIQSVQILPDTGMNMHEYAEHILSFKIPIIGFTIYESNYMLVTQLSNLLKQKNEKTIIVGGGPTATFSDTEILKSNDNIDLIVRYEGEITTLELIKSISKGFSEDQLSTIKGITYRTKNGIKRNIDRMFISDIDSIPSPYEEYFVSGLDDLGIITSRGCTFKCTYCNFAAMSKSTVRYHSIDRVISELRIIKQSFIQKNPTNPITIFDDNFSLNVERSINICNSIIDAKLKLPLTCQYRVDNIKPDFIKKLKSAGFTELSFGIESASPKVLRTIKKVTTKPPAHKNEEYLPEKNFLNKIKQAVAEAKKLDLTVSASVIYGLPEETETDAKITYEFVRELNIDRLNHNILKILPGTELFNTYEKYGLKVEKSNNLFPLFTHHAYDVSKIPIDNNTTEAVFRKIFARDLIQLNCNTLKSESQSNVYNSYIEIDSDTKIDNIIDFLKNHISINSHVVVCRIDGKAFNTKDEQSILTRFIELPTNRIYLLTKQINNYNNISIVSLKNNFLKFDFIKFSDFLTYKKLDSKEKSTYIPLVSFQDLSDAELIKEIANQYMVQKNLGDKNENIKKPVWIDACFVESCRWNTQNCQVHNLNRLIIDKEGNIKPCSKAPIIGTVLDSFNTLKKNLEKKVTEVKVLRNCNDCVIKKTCSQCFFSEPFETDIFCRLSKSKFVNKIVNSSIVVNSVSPIHNTTY